MKILIVEDDPVSRRILQAFLEEWRYEVLITSNGSEAWEALQQSQAPNLMISDWMMPDMDSLIKRADEALYLAKNKGRNCVCAV